MPNTIFAPNLQRCEAPPATSQSEQSRDNHKEYAIDQIAAIGRLRLFAIKGVEVPVLASKLLFAECGFQQCNMLESAITGINYHKDASDR